MVKHDIFDLFDELFNDFSLPENFWNNLNVAYQTPNFPPLNILINKKTKEMVFEFALAGYDKENIDISFKGDYLELSLKGGAKEKEDWEIVKCGIRNCDAIFKYYCPADKYSRDNIKANFSNGILRVIVQPKEKADTKMITIE